MGSDPTQMQQQQQNQAGFESVQQLGGLPTLAPTDPIASVVPKAGVDMPSGMPNQFTGQYGAVGDPSQAGGWTTYLDPSPPQVEDPYSDIRSQFNLGPQEAGESDKAYNFRIKQNMPHFWGNQIFNRQKENILNVLGGTLGNTWEDLTGRFGGEQQMFDIFGTGLNQFGSIGEFGHNLGGRSLLEGGTQVPNWLNRFVGDVQRRGGGGRMPHEYGEWFDDLDRGRLRGGNRFQQSLGNK